MPSAFLAGIPRLRLLCLGLSIVAAVLLGFILVPGSLALELVRYGGYWFIVGTTGWFVYLLIGIVRAAAKERRSTAGRLDWPGVATVAIGSWFLLVHEPFGFKIIMDEIMLLGTSMSMHLERVVQVPYRAHDIQGVFAIVTGAVDKRPLFFPFLVSLLHDITGYRPENVWVLNVALCVSLMGLVYVLGRRMGGWPFGALGVVLLAGLPLLAQNAKGGGFELLNLVMIALCAWLAIRALETRRSLELSGFVLGTVLLAQVRYESALFVLPAGLVVLLVWWRARRVDLPAAVIAAPVLLLPVPWLQKIFSVSQDAWQLQSKPGMEAPFSLSYVFENSAHNWAFFFARDEMQPNSWLLSLLGLVALAFLVVFLLRFSRLTQGTTTELGLAIYAFALLGLFGLLSSYFWGRFDDPIITRLSLPVHLLFVFAVLLVLARMPRSRVLCYGLLGAGFIQLWGWSLPATANHAYTLSYVHGREVDWRREFIRSQPSRDFLVIDPNSIVWISHLVSCTTPAEAIRRPEALEYNFRNRLFREFYVYQRFEVEDETGALRLDPDFDPGPAYVLEPVVERRFTALSLARISRVVSIDPSMASARGEEPSLPRVETDPTATGRPSVEEARRLFREEWFRNLP